MKQRLLILIACLLTITSAHADYLTMKVGRSKKLALSPGSDYSDRSTDKLMAVWEVDNDNVSLSEMGLSGTSPTCWIRAQAVGTSTVKCTWKQLVWDIGSLSYKENSVRTRTWYITIVEGNGGGDDEEEEQEDMIVSFVHPDLHLWITADKISGEATIANSALDPSAVDGNSIIYVYDENYVWDHINHWKNLVIPDTIRYAGYTYIITALGYKAFNRSIEVETITLPESVRSIGDLAFNWCVNLKSISMSDNVRYIGSNAFTYCRELEFIQLPDSLESIGGGAFADCKMLKEITIPQKCKSIGNDAFMWCRRLHKLTIEDSEEPLGLGYNYNLSCEYDANFYGGVPVVRGPFYDSAIDTLYIGRNICLPEEYSGLSPFMGTAANFFYDGNPSQYVNSPWNVFLLGFGDNVTKIPGNLLGGESIANEVVLPPKLEEIGSMAFYRALNQSEITIPKTVTTIGKNAFYNYATFYRYEVGRDNYDLQCWPLRRVYCQSQLPPSTEDSPFGDCIVYVPSGAGKAYREAWGGKIVDSEDEIVTINVRTPGTLYSRLLAQDLQIDDVYRLKLKGSPNEDDWKILNSMPYLYEWDLSEANITEFPKDFFWDNTELQSLKLPDRLTHVCDSAFYGCSYLSGNIACPPSCISIGYHAFENTAISGMTFSTTVNIEREAFKNCCNFERVRIPSGSNVGEGAFRGSGLKETIIEDGVKSVKSLYCEKIVFEGLVDSISDLSASEMYVPDLLTWLQLPTPSAPHLYINEKPVVDITIPSKINHIKEGAFRGCETMTSLNLQNGMKSIGDDAFGGCSNLQSVVFPSSINKIGSSAFRACKSLQEFTLPSKLTTVNCSTFSDCTGLKLINFSPTLEIIDNQAFADCTGLTKLKFPSSLLKIGAQSFSDCSDLVEINIPESVCSIESGAFSGCPNISTIVAHWNDPITITEDVFPEVTADCHLYIPIGTSTKYFNAGWNFLPKMKEAGIMTVIVKNGGAIKYGEELISEDVKDIMFTPYKTFCLNIVPDEGFQLKRLKLNGQDVLSEVVENKFYIEEPEENFTLSATFAKVNIEMGDVNEDGIVNITDAIGVVNHILKKEDDSLYNFFADMNEDEIINITDAIILIKRILNKKQ